MAKKKEPAVIDLNKRKKKMKRGAHFNIGAMIFLLIFIYMTFYVYTYMTRKKVQFYEVVEGSIVEDRKYTGIALERGESLYNRPGGIYQLLYSGRKTGICGSKNLFSR